MLGFYYYKVVILLADFTHSFRNYWQLFLLNFKLFSFEL